MTFAFTRWPDTRPDCIVVKILNILVASFFGILIGRQFIHHKILRDWCGMRMFSGCKGTHMVCLWSWAFVMWQWGAYIWNPILKAMTKGDEDVYWKNYCRSELVMSKRSFCHMAAIGTWLGDAITLVMVCDQMLQDYSQYPWWRPTLRRIWCRHRVTLSLSFLFLGTMLMVTTWFIIQTGPGYEEIMGSIANTDEFSRAMLA